MALSLPELEKKIGHKFRRKDLIDHALTHSSTGKDKNYQRLEFLGDRVLGLIVAEILYEKFPEEPEGHLAKRLAALVQGTTLAEMAGKIDLGRHVSFSDAERAAGGAENENILADVFESMIGALYLDEGFEKCRALIERLWADQFFDMEAPPQHPKTTLQEWAQAQKLPLPVYQLTGQEGPDHLPEFEITLHVGGFAPVVVKGRSRQDAEKEAAARFMARLEGAPN